MIEFIKKHYGKIGMSFALVMLVINYFQRQELAELRAKVNTEVVVGGDIQKAEVIDSLENEVFNLQTINGRYEMALEILKEDDKKAADKFELILSTQTE
jgi:hypothetical protein